MRVLFEELPKDKRAGGIDAACEHLEHALGQLGASIRRPSQQKIDGTVDDNPEVVHFHGIWSPQFARKVRFWNERGVPCVTTVHGMLEPYARSRKWLKKRVAWWLFQRDVLNQMKVLHVTSTVERDNLIALDLRAPIYLIPWGIELPPSPCAYDAPNIVCSSGSPISVKEIGGLRSGSSLKVALYVGRLCPVKGLPLLVSAWARVRPENWMMRIIGPDEAGHRRQLEALVKKNRLSDDFEFLGEKSAEQLHNFYSEADLFILPSFTENFGLVVAEAIAHGLPVITTQGTPWKSIQDSGGGWWVPATVDAIASALAEATNLEKTRLSLMGQMARKQVANSQSWLEVARRFMKLYEIANNGKNIK